MTGWARTGRWLATALCLWGSSLQASAAPLAVPDAQQFDLTASASQRTYRVFVGLPSKPAPAAGYGVLYVMDGNAMFLTALESVRALERRPDVPKDLATIVVGIGYPDGVDIGTERTLDLTPAGSGSPRIQAPSGGADAFLAFIERDLKPKVASMAKIDPDRQGIFGHSFGGLFVLHALANRPQAFQSYMAASPSVWFADPAIRDALAAMVEKGAPGDRAPRLLVTAGEYEQTPSPSMRAHPHAERMMGVLRERRQVDSARGIVELVARAAGVEARFDEIAGEDHGTVIPAAIGRAVSFMLAPPLPVPDVPTAQAYLGMTAEQRYDLRLRVRDLPDNVRIPWLNELKKTLHEGLTAAQAKMLHDERNRMDAENGTRPHAVNASE
ncbi:alpha/beta hydrolase [Pseudoxanthomonas putridarboris]|uniref:Alpha/beta hydrolase-fold protein n=1 Tax=Pseudoxanthomonas putridarboris TaxID=752605 RepID=A0ABU9IWH6_9GAMM